MKTVQHASLILLTALAMGSCSNEVVRVSSEVSERNYDFKGVTALDVASNFRVHVTFSETEEQVRIEANDNLFEKINVAMDGGRLTVNLDHNLSIKGKETLNLFVTTAAISSFKASSNTAIILDSPLETPSVSLTLSSDASFDGEVTTDSFVLNATSNSKADALIRATESVVELTSDSELRGEIVSEKALFRLTSSSTINVLGGIKELEATLSSDSQLKDYGLQVDHLKVAMSSASRSYLTVSETIDVSAQSDSRLYYKGGATIVQENLSSNGKVIKK